MRVAGRSVRRCPVPPLLGRRGGRRPTLDGSPVECLTGARGAGPPGPGREPSGGGADRADSRAREVGHGPGSRAARGFAGRPASLDPSGCRSRARLAGEPRGGGGASPAGGGPGRGGGRPRGGDRVAREDRRRLGARCRPGRRVGPRGPRSRGCARRHRPGVAREAGGSPSPAEEARRGSRPRSVAALRGDSRAGQDQGLAERAVPDAAPRDRAADLHAGPARQRPTSKR